MQIDESVWYVLRNAWCDGNVLKLPPEQLDRTVYEGVNEVVTRLGGKWKGGKTKGHVFAFYAPAPLLASVQATGIMPPKNPTAFFPTPASLVDDMIRAADIHDWSEARYCEPNGGTGAIADAIRAAAPNATLDVCEILDLNRAVLESKGYAITAEDFLAWNPSRVYDAIIMNPPFAAKDDATAWLTHLLHAWSLLKCGGKLVCIAPSSLRFNDSAAIRAARDLILQHGGMGALPAGTFKVSGTMAATEFITMHNVSQEWREQECQGWPNYHQMLLFLHIDNDQKNSDTFNALIDRQAPDSDVLNFLSKIVEQAKAIGDWICWDATQQQLALAEYRERAGLVLEETPVVVEKTGQLSLF